MRVHLPPPSFHHDQRGSTPGTASQKEGDPDCPHLSSRQERQAEDFPGGGVAKNPPANAET